MTPKSRKVDAAAMNAPEPQPHTLSANAVLLRCRRESRALENLICGAVGVIYAVHLARQYVKRQHPLSSFARRAASEPDLDLPIDTAALEATDDRRRRKLNTAVVAPRAGTIREKSIAFPGDRLCVAANINSKYVDHCTYPP